MHTQQTKSMLSYKEIKCAFENPLEISKRIMTPSYSLENLQNGFSK